MNLLLRKVLRAKIKVYTFFYKQLNFSSQPELGVINASFSKFSVIATHSSVYVSFRSIDLVRIFFGFIFDNAELEG